MAGVIKKPDESQLVAPCLLRYFEIAAAIELWVALTAIDSPRLARIGPIHPLHEDTPLREPVADYSKRIALGILALSKESD